MSLAYVHYRFPSLTGGLNIGSFFMQIEYAMVALGVFAFCGGMIDAAVGGGGLVQVPALLHALPQHSLSTVFGTNKLAVLVGNISSIFSYVKK